MSDDAKQTVRQLIAELVRREEVPESFVLSVTGLLEQKGIALDDDAAPWAEILSRSFRSRAETHRICSSMMAAVREMTETLEHLREEFLRLAERAQHCELKMRDLLAAARAARAAAAEQKKHTRFLLIAPKLLPN